MKNKTIETEVKKLLGKETGEVTENDILQVTELKLNKLGLSDISDLSEFKNLVKLEINDNSLTDLSPLSTLTKLEVLYASNDPFLPNNQKPKQKNS